MHEIREEVLEMNDALEASNADPLLVVDNLVTAFETDRGEFRAVDGVSFHISAGETVALVGESGSGKSVTALSIMGLVPRPHGRIVSGKILYRDRDLAALSNKQMRSVRGNDISMIFQDPMSSLNPVFTVGNQMVEALREHQRVTRREARERALAALRDVQIADPEKRIDQYPFELSGGMRQRVMIAMALMSEPDLLIADEPTTALDVTVQAQILDLLKSIQRERNLALLLVTHDLGVVADMADRVLVCYAGRLVERAGYRDLFKRPLHPYTEGLMRAIPDLDADVERLHTIEGTVPEPNSVGDWCAFASRCDYADQRCFASSPVLRRVATAREAACHRADELVLGGSLGGAGYE